MFAGRKGRGSKVPKWERPHPPGVFSRKNVILGELSCEIAQECDSTGFIADRADPGADGEVSRGLVGAITTQDSMKC
jgi:hypothetical protein